MKKPKTVISAKELDLKNVVKPAESNLVTEHRSGQIKDAKNK